MLALLRGLLGGRLAAADFFLRVHGSAALFGAAVADGFVVAAVIQAIIVGNLLARGDVLDGRDPHAAAHFAGLAVGVATVVDEHRHAVAVDDHRAVAESKEIGDGRVLVGASASAFVMRRPVYSATRVPLRMAVVV